VVESNIFLLRDLHVTLYIIKKKQLMNTKPSKIPEPGPKKCEGLKQNGEQCQRFINPTISLTPYCYSHNPKVNTALAPREWLPFLEAHQPNSAYLMVWKRWVLSQASRLHCFSELTDDQCQRITRDLGYSSSDRMLRCVCAASVAGAAFLRVTRRDLRNIPSLLASAAHELMHCLLPEDMNVSLEESICVLTETCVTKRLIVEKDLRKALAEGKAMHPTNGASRKSGEDVSAELRSTLARCAVSGGPLSILAQAETVESFLIRAGISIRDLHVCRNRRERLACDALEYEAFHGRGMPGPLDDNEIVFVHSAPDGGVRTVLRVCSRDRDVLYVGAFVSSEPRSGHGRRAMELLVRFARIAGLKNIELHSEELPHLRKIYQSLGFRIVERETGFYGDGRAGLKWQKCSSMEQPQ
jgi:hypothetical protein